MAAYCRVSTDQAEQLSSYEAQVNDYTSYINNHPDYEMAGIYADEGISGTNTKKREQFNKMVEDCKAGKIDMIITKSISRFARNTLDTLNYVGMLKELGIGIIFEKENISTLDSKGEVLLTRLSSLAQTESRSISENSTWGIRRRFEQGKVIVNHTKFMGYDKDESGNLIINEKQAKVVRRIYADYLNGKGTNRIAYELENGGIPNWNGKAKWYEGSIRKMLSNEKYKGEALLQKTYTVDFLSKKRELRIKEKCHNIMLRRATHQLLIKIHGKQYSLRGRDEELMLKNITFKRWTMLRTLTHLQAELSAAAVVEPMGGRYGTLMMKD